MYIPNMEKNMETFRQEQDHKRHGGELHEGFILALFKGTTENSKMTEKIQDVKTVR